jgi:hypothetical protein
MRGMAHLRRRSAHGWRGRRLTGAGPVSQQCCHGCWSIPSPRRIVLSCSAQTRPDGQRPHLRATRGAKPRSRARRARCEYACRTFGLHSAPMRRACDVRATCVRRACDVHAPAGDVHERTVSAP